MGTSCSWWIICYEYSFDCICAAKEVKSASSCSNVSASSSNNLGSHKAIVRLHIPIAGPVKMVRGENSPRRHNIIPPGGKVEPHGVQLQLQFVQNVFSLLDNHPYYCIFLRKLGRLKKIWIWPGTKLNLAVEPDAWQCSTALCSDSLKSPISHFTNKSWLHKCIWAAKIYIALNRLGSPQMSIPMLTSPTI